MSNKSNKNKYDIHIIYIPTLSRAHEAAHASFFPKVVENSNQIYGS